jgi:hypothetical protein
VKVFADSIHDGGLPIGGRVSGGCLSCEAPELSSTSVYPSKAAAVFKASFQVTMVVPYGLSPVVP